MAQLRLLVLGLSLSVLVWADVWIPPRVLGQINQPVITPREVGLGGLNLADRTLIRNLTAAEKKVADGDSYSAASLIQQLLTQNQDGFYRPTGDTSGRYLSLKRQASQMLQAGTPALRQSYELQFGVEAREKLELAIANQDSKLAQEVTQRFLYTSAGAEACYWLATTAMDKGDYFSAIQYLNRLRSLPLATRFEPRLSLRMGLCWSRLGSPERALPLIQAVQAVSREPIQIGNQELALNATTAQILAWLKALSLGDDVQPPRDLKDWQLARGTVDRNPQRQTSPPAARTLWQVALNTWQVRNRKTLEPETITIVPSLTACQLIHQEAAVTPLPGTIPLVVKGLVITRYCDHIAAVDAKTGREVWSTFERDRTFQEVRGSVGSAERVTSAFSNGNMGYAELLRILVRQRMWEDLTHGTLSSDGEYVFAIEDLGVINPLDAESGNPKPHPLAMKDYNRLCAYDVATGKLRWELGGANSSVKLDQAGSFFLGPPMPAGQHLYCLAENQGFIKLLVVDSRTGKEQWSQNLAQSSEDLQFASHRRRAGLTPSMTDDLLVCPTGTGYVVAIDIGAKLLAWAYQYVTPSTEGNNPNVRFIGRRFRVGNGGDAMEFNPERPAITNEWQDASPILTNTHVILTPRDSNELHCLSLQDGSLAWKVPRGEGQYIAGVRDGAVIVVNKQSVDALQLTDGKSAWVAPVPVINQTGRGITTNTHLVLPLVNGQVVSIEFKTGRKFYSRVRGADQESLGNLVAGADSIFSQSPNELSAFRTLEAIYPESVARLEANPNDPEALAQRGEYRLSINQIPEGQADLRASIRLKKSADAEFLLFESLLEGLRSDFKNYKQFVLEAESLAHSSVQKSALYRIWGVGLRQLNDYFAAFEMLEKLNRADLGKPELERVDGNYAIRRDLWIRNELQQIQASATPADRDRMQVRLQQIFDAAKANPGIDELRQLTRFVGSGLLADEARLVLAERLASKEYTLEVEHLLSSLRKSRDPKIAAKAIGLMVTGMIKLGRADEASGLITELEQAYPTVMLDQNKTATQQAAEWRTMSAAAGAGGGVNFEDWPKGRVTVTREVMEKGDIRINLEVPLESDRGPFYSDLQMRFESGAQRFLGLTGWSKPRFAMPLSELMPITNTSALHAYVNNHIVLLNTGLSVIAINTLTDGQTIRSQRIWSSPLVEGPITEDNNAFQPPRPRPGIGRPRLLGQDRWRNPLGMIGAVQDDSLCLIRGRHLLLIDILTGETLWKRTNMVPGSEIFGDGETIFVISPQTPGILQTPVARRIRRADGVELPGIPVPDAMNRIQTFGARLLSAVTHPEFPATKQILKLEDLTQNKTEWEFSIALGSQVSLIGDSEIAVLEPSGLVSYLKTESGKVLWTQQLQPVAKRKDFTVVADGTRLLLLRDEIPPRNFPLQPIIAVNGSQQNLMFGQAECLDRATGQPLWSHRIEHYALDLSVPNGSPLWFFTARALAQQIQLSEIRMLAIDKRTGKVALQQGERAYGHGFDFAIDPKEKQLDITLLGSQQPIRHRLKLTDQPLPVPEEKK